MKLGALVLQTDPWPQAVELWRRFDGIGIDTAYVADHLTHPTVAGRWWADPWTTLAAAAVVTERVHLGTLVASAAVRTPTVLARTAATLQDVSDGRFVLGLGMGVLTDVVADRGVNETPSQMFARFSDVVLGVRALWAGDPGREGSTVSFDGVEPLAHAPGRAAPPLVLAAHGARGLALTAGAADGWTSYGGPRIRDAGRAHFWAALGAQAAAMNEACSRVGRDHGSLSRSVLLGYAAYPPIESPDLFVDEVGRAEAAGFDEVCFYWPPSDRDSRFWHDEGVVLAAVAAVREVWPSG